ncbi:uncharacterized protein K452DRAFT_265959 [Aplosporella prunicola CBS 121167]|uniref:DUF218 domain-containing protein n=1 Tax=Aplosporella prunicola CBS 121167 TaxID=1176127 RepID=A0A6A6BPK5_9PEZI|nr:uncharacterized protein K452DRAFT_265959 [Aplosporella prunicola CBS 121167]KAF2145215.1 hypothetical protein K452DRAFT_265959 [Aplosporella prunicola CBS 121167]
MPQYTDLVVVCCHAIFLGDIQSRECDVFSASQWYLQSFQKPTGTKPGEHETFIQHIKAGLDALVYGAIKDTGLLVFSGGATARSVTSLSEAQSYFNAVVALSKSSNLDQSYAQCLKSRVLLEENATDSYQNLLFSILRFRRATGTYPKTIRIITHAFKTERFLMAHAKALRWPEDRIRIQGIDPVMSATEHVETVTGERMRGLTPWTQDMYGTRAPLSVKRAQRGWQDSRLEDVGDELGGEMWELLRYDGGEDGQMIYKGPLPWSTRLE